MLAFHKKLLNVEHFLQYEKHFATGAQDFGKKSVLKNDLLKNKYLQKAFLFMENA